MPGLASSTQGVLQPALAGWSAPPSVATAPLGDGSDADDGAFAKARAREVESSYAKLLAALSGAERDKLERDIGPRIAGMQAMVKQLPQF